MFSDGMYNIGYITCIRHTLIKVLQRTLLDGCTLHQSITLLFTERHTLSWEDLQNKSGGPLDSTIIGYMQQRNIDST